MASFARQSKNPCYLPKAPISHSDTIIPSLVCHRIRLLGYILYSGKEAPMCSLGRIEEEKRKIFFFASKTKAALRARAQ